MVNYRDPYLVHVAGKPAKRFDTLPKACHWALAHLKFRREWAINYDNVRTVESITESEQLISALKKKGMNTGAAFTTECVVDSRKGTRYNITILNDPEHPAGSDAAALFD